MQSRCLTVHCGGCLIPAPLPGIGPSTRPRATVFVAVTIGSRHFGVRITRTSRCCLPSCSWRLAARPTPAIATRARMDSEAMPPAAIYAALRSAGRRRSRRRPGGETDLARLPSYHRSDVADPATRCVGALDPGMVAIVSALPEWLAAGDYTTAAEDKPALVVTNPPPRPGQASELPSHRRGLLVGAPRRPPAAAGTVPPAPRE